MTQRPDHPVVVVYLKSGQTVRFPGQVFNVRTSTETGKLISVEFHALAPWKVPYFAPDSIAAIVQEPGEAQEI